MLESKYSKPEFNPYENDDLVLGGEPVAWPAPRATGPLSATVSIPGSKSLTARELVLAALADGPSLLRSPLFSRDTNLMVEALRALGVDIREVEGEGAFGPDLLVTPGELSGGTTIDCGLAGTVMRFVPPLAALALGPVAFDGDAAARKRPMKPVLDSLLALGVDVSDDGRRTLPFSLYGTGSVAGGRLDIDASVSSQFISAFLLVGARFEQGLELHLVGDRVPSEPHIDMTIATLAARGVTVTKPARGVWAIEPGPIHALDITIEPDLSNAAPFLAAALVAGGTVTVDGWPVHTTQVGAELERLLPLFGATVTRTATTLTVDGGVGVIGGTPLRGIDLDLSEGGELAPTLVALAAFADSPSRITGIGHLRGHETDRLAALVNELNVLGGDASELDDGIEVRPRALHGGEWKSYEDHRIATAGAIIGLGVDGVTVENVATTAKTLPEFVELWEGLVHPSTGARDPLTLGLI